MKPNWEFASTGGGFEEGINNTLTEHFEGNYNYYLAREIIQNSLDARDSEREPVKVVFELQELDSVLFPGRERFTKILDLCYQSHPQDKKNCEFFQNATGILSDNKIHVLKISDYNTIGLHGSDKERHSPWFSLVKSRGVSQKTEGAGGSFGLGKGAAFAASDLRTVFYSTKSKKDAKTRYIGVSMLVNFDEEGDTRQSIGSFGLRNQSTIYDPMLMDEFRRKEKGLDVYIWGYKVGKNWDDELMKSVLRNFWYAILNEDLVVEVGNKKVNFNNVEQLLTLYFSSAPLKDYDEPKGNPLYYYQAVMASESKSFTDSLPKLGKVKFHFLKLSEQLNYVAMLRRSHMVIYSRIFNFPAPYAGVFICDDHDGNEILRQMEPPAHDRWDPDRIKEDGRPIMDSLTDWIRNCLKMMKEERSKEFSTIPDLAKYLPLLEEESNPDLKTSDDEKEGEVDTEETQRLLPESMIFQGKAIIEPYKVGIINKEDIGFGGSGRIIRNGNRKLRKKRPGPGVGPGNIRALTENEFKARIFSLTPEFQEQEYLCIISGNFDGKCNIKLSAVGDDGNEKVRIKEVKDPRHYQYHIANNVIHGFYMESNTQTKISIKLFDRMKVAIKVDAYEI